MTTPVIVVPPGPVKVNVEVSMVAGFIASLKVAVMMVLVQTPSAPVGGATASTVGAANPGPPDLSGSLHAFANTSSRETTHHIAR